MESRFAVSFAILQILKHDNIELVPNKKHPIDRFEALPPNFETGALPVGVSLARHVKRFLKQARSVHKMDR